MKANIHPKYNQDCQVTCTCGNSFVTGSTLDKIEVEVCSNCHPFFTGQQKFVDVKGRIDRFKEKQAKGQTFQSKATKAKAKADKKATA
jgi:large subunit ribosomal protein L31